MAQSTVPVYLTGKLGAMVYTPNRQGTAVRTLVTPRNPATTAQTAQRAIFAAVGAAWRGITQIQRNSWSNLVSAFANNLAPFNIYMKVNAVLDELGQALVTTAPAMPAFAALTFTPATPTAVNAAGVLTLTCAPSMSPAPGFYLYYASKPHSVGISSKVPLKVIGHSTGASPLSASALSTAYNNAFGVPPVGTRIALKVVPVINGIKGSAPTLLCNVTSS